MIGTIWAVAVVQLLLEEEQGQDGQDFSNIVSCLYVFFYKYMGIGSKQ